MTDQDPFTTLGRGPGQGRPDTAERGRRAARAAQAPLGTVVGVPAPSGPPPLSSDDLFGVRATTNAGTATGPSTGQTGSSPALPSRRALREAAAAAASGSAATPSAGAADPATAPGEQPPPPVTPGDGPTTAIPRRGRSPWMSIALLAISLLMAAVSACTLVNTPSALVAGAAGFAPTLLLPGLAVVAWSVHTRRHVTVVLACVAALLPWLLVGGYLLAAPAPPAGDLGVRMMLVDGGHGQASATDLVAVAQRQRADLLVVTDLTDVLAHDLTVAGVGATLQPQWVAGEEGAHQRMGIWSRYPVEQVLPVEGGNGSVVTASLRTPSGVVTLLVARVHAPALPGPSAGDSRDWADDLREAAGAASVATAKGPTVMLGNLHATAWNAPFRRLLATSKLKDAADQLGRGLRPTWPAWGPLAVVPLDHVLVGDGVGVREVRTDGVEGSSHRVLIAEVTVPSAG